MTNTTETTLPAAQKTQPIGEHPLNAKELMALLRIGHSATLRQKILNKTVPKPDIQTSKHHRLWHRASLRAAGILIDQPTTATTKGATS